MAILRDSIWTAIQEFRLPNEDELLDALYDEFGSEPFAILLPTQSQAERGDAPFYEAGRDVLHGTLSKFLVSDDWRDWALRDGAAAAATTTATAEASSAPVEDTSTSTQEPTDSHAPEGMGGASRKAADAAVEPPTAQPQKSSWDGWD